MLVKPEILELMKAKEKRRLDSFDSPEKNPLVMPRERTGSIARKNEEFERRKARAEKFQQIEKME